MPNWADNELYIRGPAERLAQVRETLESQDRLLDFNKVIPMPRGYNYVPSPAPGIPMNEPTFQQWLDTLPNGIDREEYIIELLEAAGVTTNSPLFEERCSKTTALVGYLSMYLNARHKHPTWYDWCWANWGTKWNASNIERSETKSCLRYGFDTAWDQPVPILRRLIADNPDLRFVAKAWDGGAGWKRVVHGAKGATVVGAQERYSGNRGG